MKLILLSSRLRRLREVAGQCRESLSALRYFMFDQGGLSVHLVGKNQGSPESGFQGFCDTRYI